MTRLSIDGSRLWNDLMTMGAIGATPGGGSRRPAFSRSDVEGRNLFAHWAQQAGLAVSVDGIGNMFARREGQDPSLAPVMIGSHLDTQTPGGRFDGVLGVLAGLAALRALDDNGIQTCRAIEVVNWSNEEGARFVPGLMGSSVFVGTLPLARALACRDAQGVTVEDELRATGYAGSTNTGGRGVHSYLELHIEQGPELETTGTMIGIVTNSSYSCSGTIEIRGFNGHAQTTAMSKRRNALIGASKLVLTIEKIGAAQEPHGMVSATALDILPNNRNNIPDFVKLSYAVVHESTEGRQAIVTAIEAAVRSVAGDTGLYITATTALGRERLDFSTRLIGMAEEAAHAYGHSAMRLPTLTAHDALRLHEITETALIFVPCRDGISHNEREWCEPDQATAGANVILSMALQLADDV